MELLDSQSQVGEDCTDMDFHSRQVLTKKGCYMRTTIPWGTKSLKQIRSETPCGAESRKPTRSQTLEKVAQDV